MARETESQAPKEEAPVGQVTTEEHDARVEAPEEQEGSSSNDSDEEGAQQGEISRPSSRSNIG
jgi:hypothetical protein